jgi:hypothetical protein
MHRAAREVALCALGLLAVVSASCSKSDEKTASVPPPAPAVAPPAPVVAPPAAAPKPAPFQVTRIDLGNAIGAGKNVTAPTSTFKASDTIYASVVSEGSAPSVLLSARWTYEDGQVVSESQQSIAPSGPAATEFHISKPDGWPAGKYQVAIAANGLPAGIKEFTVVD